MKDTIVALATPPGRSGIGVLRLSGADSLDIVRELSGDPEFNPEPRKAYLKKIYDIENRDLIDQSVICFFKAPQSFTGEDVVEISCHGSPVLLRQILDFCLKLDARIAQPGEFSLRALSNGRMDLSQAEAIRDLIDAQTAASARQAVRQLRGELSNSLQPLKDDLLDVIVILESNLEFVEDDLPVFQTEKIKLSLTEISKNLEKMASTFRLGKLLREGLKVTLAGRPNVGKSSLFNALTGQERAIVTDVAGTTRDSLRENLSIDGIPIHLIDTAGLRETVDKVERIGVERTKLVMSDSDLVIIVFDGSQDLSSEDKDIISENSDLDLIAAINKKDLPSGNLNYSFFPEDVKIIEVSAKTGEGLLELQRAITEPFLTQNSNGEGLLISNARHLDLLVRARQEIENSLVLLDSKMSEEIILIGLHNAIRLLGEITGETTNEDMLTRIFSTFCIGK